MKNSTKTLLFGGTLIAAGIVHTPKAHAEIDWWVSSYVYASIGYQNHANWSFSPYGQFFDSYGTTVSINQGGVSFETWLADAYSFSYGYFTVLEETTFDVHIDIGVEGYAIFAGEFWNEDIDTTITLEAAEEYYFSFMSSEGISDMSFQVVIPAPSALALLGLVGVATRRRRK